jgi:hypothetical protein
MERVAVSSSNLVSVGYDESTSTLEIEFNSGVYQYYNVPVSIHEELMGAGSHGVYFRQSIKDVYECSKV